MVTIHPVFKRAFLILVVFLMTLPLPSCGDCPSTSDRMCKLIADAPLKELTSSDRTMVFEEQGTIIVFRGSGCAESKKSGQEEIIKIEQSLDLPPYVTNATVFLNGWVVKYLSKDHHVGAFATAIGKISLERNTLKWRASGLLSDDDFDDSYSWCYTYTVVAWNDSNLNLAIDHKDGGCDSNSTDPSQANFFVAKNEGTTTALSSYRTFLLNPDFAASKTVAILPRGFVFGWGCGEDHHLIQIGYNMDHSEVFIENGTKYKKKEVEVAPTLPNNASRVDSGFVSWETSAILKDNKGRRGYDFGEIVSGLGGKDVGIIQPPFSSLPIEDEGRPCVWGGGAEGKEFVVENIPFAFAIPMLTGWEMGYGQSIKGCDDEHITEMGMRIDEWSYTRNPAAPTGTLRYKLTSAFRDKDSFPGHYFRHKVTILGLRSTAGGTTDDKIADLVPFSPLGTSPSAFCRLEQGNKQLRVTVKNQGNGDAAPSQTTVIFGNTTVTLPTPFIPAGGSVDLLFNVPGNCFSPDCSFKITVDANNQINESNHEGNNTANGGCIG